jgi:hypothetical protein
MTTMLTWQADDGHGFEGTRLLLGAGKAFRAMGRLVRADPGAEYTASYRLVVSDDGTVERVSITSATAARERHLTLNRTDDGYWLLDTGSGGARAEFGGAVDVDVSGSAMFNTLPVRRLGLHREPGDHAIPVVFVSLPGLEVTLAEQRYRTVSTDGAGPVVEFSSDGVTAELRLDDDAVVASYPGLATRYVPAPAG